MQENGSFYSAGYEYFKEGKTTNLGKYEALYTDKSLSHILSEMFLERYLYRASQLSRAHLEQKMVYIGRIERMKKAFLEGCFKYIR